MPHKVNILADVTCPGLASCDAVPFLTKVTEIVPSIIYVFNQQTQSNEYSNRSLGTSLGYSSQDVQEMGSALMPQLCHPDDLPKIAAHFESLKTLSDGEVLRIEYRMRHKLGYWVWLLSTDTVFERHLTGQVVRHIGVASDITAQKAAEEEARAEHLKATATNDELQAFSYSMSHDMKAPSNTLNLLLTELLDTHGASFDADAVTLVNMALTTVGRMSGLVDDVLNYTRVINHEFVAAPVPLNAVIKGVIEDLEALIRSEGAEIEIEDLPVVSADQMQIRILLKNLIENAIKFHSPGVAPTVRVRASAPSGNADWAITVSDSGIGIRPHKHEEIFTLFRRLNAESEYAGTGLGLAICRRIAANHGSTITLVSSAGNGSAFTIALPRA